MLVENQASRVQSSYLDVAGFAMKFTEHAGAAVRAQASRAIERDLPEHPDGDFAQRILRSLWCV